MIEVRNGDEDTLLRMEIALIIAFLPLTLVNWILISPEDTVTGTDSTKAVLWPAVWKTSKFDSTVVPLIATLNTRCPTAVDCGSAKARLTL